jgi:hypothetical protein
LFFQRFGQAVGILAVGVAVTDENGVIVRLLFVPLSLQREPEARAGIWPLCQALFYLKRREKPNLPIGVFCCGCNKSQTRVILSRAAAKNLWF